MRSFAKKFKKGAASFYIVAFTTLILLVLAVSFATVIMGQIERASNDDLSQSAYDSAMAGVEDAKIAFYNYQTCKTKGSTDAYCDQIISLFEGNSDDCGMVGKILGRIAITSAYPDTEVVIEDRKEITGSVANENNMQQAYTCAKMKMMLSDYTSTLSATNPLRVVKVQLKNGVHASDIVKAKVSWYSGEEEPNYRNFITRGDRALAVFPAIGDSSTIVPPVISVGLVQTGPEFIVSSFDNIEDTRTNRGLVYLVPSNSDKAKTNGASNAEVATFGAFHSAWNSARRENVISASQIVKTNDKKTKNLPYAVYCERDGGYACSTTLELPEPVGGARNDDTFMFVIALPYSRPTTDVALTLFCADGRSCGEEIIDDSGAVTTTNQASLSGVQVKVDSTGRANDIYRRVEVRLEAAVDESYVSLLGPLELYSDDDTGTDTDGGFEKKYTVLNDYVEKQDVLAHDTVVLVDTTGSMAGPISGAKTQAVQLGKETLDLGGRYALYEYRDGNVDGPAYQPVTERCSITDCTAENFEDAINSLSVGGGGDAPESAMAAARYIMENIPWDVNETKAIVILTDAPYLDPDYDGTTAADVIRISQEIDPSYPVNIYAVGPGAHYFQSVADATGGRVVTNFGDLWLYREGDTEEGWDM